MRSTLLRAVLAAVLLCLGGGRVLHADAGGCHSYAGEFTAVTLAECPSFLCNHGTLTGDLEGTYDFVATAITPEGGLVGQSTITLATGAVIRGRDTSVVNPDGTFVTTVNVVGGTRQFRHATGGIVAAGHFTPNGTEGLYSGVVCLGAKKPK
jgi:hypothetical protein